MNDPHKNVGLRITSDPETTRMTVPGAKATPREAALPLRLLLVADLAPEARPSWRQDALVRRVDAHRFAEVLEAMAPTLRLDVPNRLGPQPATLEIALRFRALKDFSPGGVAAQVPALARLLAIRTEVHGVRSKGTDRESFRARLADAGVDAASADALYGQLTAPPPKPKPARDPDDPLDRLMGMVDTGDGSPAEPTGLGEALADAVSDDGPRIARSAADEIVEDFDRKLGAQLRALLEHPDFRRLEAAWRGLKFLVDRLPPRVPVLLDVLPAPREALAEALYYQVLVPEHEAEHAAPLSVVLLGFAYDNSQADVAALEDLAETGASLQAPVIASVSPTFFGLDGPGDETPLPLVPQMTAGPAYIHWTKLREREDAGFVALAYPPFLLRAPYGAENPAKAFPLEEEGSLWGGGALAVGAGAVVRAAGATVLRSDVPFVSEIGEGVAARRSDEGDVATAPAVPSRRAAAGDELLSTKRDGPVTAAPGRCFERGFVDEHRGTAGKKNPAWMPGVTSEGGPSFGRGGLGIDRDKPLPAHLRLELHDTLGEGEQRVVAAAADVVPGMELRAELADDDAPCADVLTAVALHTAPLSGGVTPVARASLSFLVCHLISPTRSRR